MKRLKARGLLAAILVLMAIIAACQKAPATQPSATVPAETSGAASPSAALTSVTSRPLAAVWSAWDILRNGYVDKQKLDAEQMSKAAVKAVVERVESEHRVQVSLSKAKAKPPKEMPRELQPLWEGWAALYEGYSGSAPLDDTRLGQEAIRAFVRWLQDPHTEYIVPEQYSSWSEDFNGNYGGIGAEVYLRGDKIILNPMPTSPAEIAGLKPGDTLVAVEGEPVEGWSLLKAVSRIRGKKGTSVSLTILHLGANGPLTLSITRDSIRLQSVFWNMTNDQFAYIRLSFFYENAPEALAATLREALGKGARGVVLDLRNNPGGFLRATVEVASQFVGEQLVAYEVDGSGKRTEWNAARGGLALDVPLVVLVNQFTASGSEVLAGALQDYGRAQLVGMTTFGKGSVNLFRGLPDGGGLYYTTARWYTPKGRIIEGKGLEPDHVVVASPGGRGGDTQLDRGLEVLRQQIGASTTSR